MLFPAATVETEILCSSEKDECKIATFSINPQVAPVDSRKTPLFGETSNQKISTTSAS
jgi:hypothetical protein